MSWQNLLVVAKSMVFTGLERDNIKIKLKILIQCRKGEDNLLYGIKKNKMTICSDH